MKKLIIFIGLISASFLSSCKEEITAEHTNPLDPESESYTPTNPKYYSYEINEDYIKLRWLDRSEGEYGFIISKYINGQYFSVIDTVSAPVPKPSLRYDYEYIDSFHVAPGNTYYYNIEPYAKYHQTYNPELMTVSVNLYPPYFIDLFQNNSTSVTFEIRFTKSSYEPHKHVIERKVFSTSDAEFAAIDTIDNGRYHCSDSRLDQSKKFVYRFYSISKYFRSAYSDTVCIAYNGIEWGLWKPGPRPR